MARMLSVLALVFLATGLGCAPPVLSVHHRLAPDLPIPPGVRHVRLGAITVASGPEETYPAFVAETLATRLEATGAYGARTTEAGGAAGPDEVTVGAVLRIEVSDAAGTRMVRRRNTETQRLESVEVPTLVRSAEVVVIFSVQEASGGAPIAAAETREVYRSTADPRTRGPLGLDRPDDPAHVPPTESIVCELLTACVDTFVGMMTPGDAVARIPLCPARGASGAKGLDAARRGAYADAGAHFRDALRNDPANVDMLFNLAAVSECAGDLEAAFEAYEKVRELSGDADAAAREGAIRVGRAMAP